MGSLKLTESTGSNRRFTAPTGSATESAVILFIFTEGCLLQGSFTQKYYQETHRLSSARDFARFVAIYQCKVIMVVFILYTIPLGSGVK